MSGFEGAGQAEVKDVFGVDATKHQVKDQTYFSKSQVTRKYLLSMALIKNLALLTTSPTIWSCIER